MNDVIYVSPPPVEAPQLVYPKGPLRAIVQFRAAVDQLAGEIVIVTLAKCGHQATLVGHNLTNAAMVRCAICFHKRMTAGAGETIIEAGEDRGPRA